MDPRELTSDFWEAMRMLIIRHQQNLWTAFPAIVKTWNYPKTGKNTVIVTCATMLEHLQEDGTHKSVPMVDLHDCPVHYAGSGGFTLTHPIAAGDEGMVVVASRCIDGWHQNGGVQPRPAYGKGRMHNLSDCMFVPGLASVPKTPPAISTTSVQLRLHDGKSYIEVLPDGKGHNLVTPKGTLKLDENGDVHVSGNLIVGKSISSGSPAGGP